VQVQAPGERDISGAGNGLADDFDFDSEIEVLPGAVRGEGRGLALYGESQACAVAERQAEGLRDLHQTSCNPCLIFVKGRRFALEFGDVPPGNLLLHAGGNQLGLHLGLIHSADHGAGQTSCNRIGPCLAAKQCHEG